MTKKEEKKQEILLECAALTVDECNALETFLKSRSDLVSLRRKAHSPRPFDRDNAGTFSFSHYDIVLSLGKEALDLLQKAAETYVTVLVAEWVKSRRGSNAAGSKTEPEREFKAVPGADGNTVKVVLKSGRKRK